jgi:hypothetical protein
MIRMAMTSVERYAFSPATDIKWRNEESIWLYAKAGLILKYFLGEHCVPYLGLNESSFDNAEHEWSAFAIVPWRVRVSSSG